MSNNNADEIARKIREFQEQVIKQAMLQGMNDVLNFCEDESKKTSPIMDGRLRASIESEAGISGSHVEGCLYTNVEYAPYKHEGTGIYAKSGGRQIPWVYPGKDGQFVFTRGQKAKPFMKDAVMKNTSKIKMIMKNGIKKKL